MSLFARHDPATQELVWQGRTASPEDIKTAFIEARKQLSAWSALPMSERVPFLERFQERVDQDREEIATCISQETGKPLWDTRNEVQTLYTKVQFTLDAYSARCADRIVSHPLCQSITRHRPLGVALLLGPFNFPVHIPHGHLLPALLTGNTIIWKPSPYTPKTAERMMQLWQSTGLPAGVLQLLQGGSETGIALVNSPGWDLLTYTGSSAVGQQILHATQNMPDKLIALEMGGNNPLVVSIVTDLDAAAYTIIQSAFMSSGQRCSCTRRLIVIEQENTPLLLQTLVEWTQKLSIGPYSQIPEPFMGPLITPEAAQSILHAQEELLAKHAKPLLLAKQLPLGKAFLSPGILDVTDVKEREDRELFGPFLQVIRVRSMSEAIREANNTHYGLTAGLLSNDHEEYRHFFQEIRAGVIQWNMPTTGVSSAQPFGGVGWSGNFRPSGFYAIDACCYPVASMERPLLALPKDKEYLPGIPGL